MRPGYIIPLLPLGHALPLKTLLLAHSAPAPAYEVSNTTRSVRYPKTSGSGQRLPTSARCQRQ